MTAQFNIGGNLSTARTEVPSSPASMPIVGSMRSEGDFRAYLRVDRSAINSGWINANSASNHTHQKGARRATDPGYPRSATVKPKSASADLGRAILPTVHDRSGPSQNLRLDWQDLAPPAQNRMLHQSDTAKEVRVCDLPVGRFADRAVESRLQKYFASPVGQIISTNSRHPTPPEGRIMVVTDAGWGAVDAAAFCA